MKNTGLSFTLSEKSKSAILIFAAVALFAFGSFNLALDIYAAEPVMDIDPGIENDVDKTQDDPWAETYRNIVEQLLSIGIPFIGTTLTVMFQYMRNKGIAISKDAEEYVISSAESIAKNQGRLLFDSIYTNKDLLFAYANGSITPEGTDKLSQNLKKLKADARTKAIEDLQSEIKSSKFKSHAKKFVAGNLENLIDRAITENESKKAKLAEKLLVDLSGLAVDAGLLYYDKKTLTNDDKKKIVEDGIEILKKNFDFESLILMPDNARIHLEAALSAKLNNS